MRSWRNRGLMLVLVGALALAACDRLPNPAADGEGSASDVDLSDPDVGGGAGEETGPQTAIPPATETREPSPRLDATAAAALPTAVPTAAVATAAPTSAPLPTQTPAPTTAAVTEPATVEPTLEPTAAPTTTPEISPTPEGESEVPPGSQPPIETIHTVQPGENLYRIGLQYGLSWVVIAEYNGITDPNAITVGQEIRIPPAPSPTPTAEAGSAAPGGETAAASDAAPAAATSTAEPISSATTAVTVTSGDTLYSIAQRYGVTWDQVAEANGLTSPNQIYAGQVLKIPTDIPGSTPEFAHRVHSGDTLARIAAQYGLLLSALAEANGLTAPYVIYPGQELVIPGE